MDDEEIFSLSLDIGKEIIKSGGEINRAKDTIIRINNAYGMDCQVFAIPTLIIAQCNNTIQIRRIDEEDTNLSELGKLNSLSRRLCFETNEEIHITKKKIYSKVINLLATAIATSSFSIFFGGSMLDALFAAIIGIIITVITITMVRLPLFSSNLINSFIACILAHLPNMAGLNVHPDKIIIGAIMLLVPGLTVVNAIRDMMSGDLIAGLFELINSIMSALAIALGVAGGIVIFK